MDTTSTAPYSTFLLGGDLPVNRLGFGAMRITRQAAWGQPTDRPAMLALLRRVVELGVNFIDTADMYGPFVSEELIAEALHPYAAGLVIGTKGGCVSYGPPPEGVLLDGPPSTCAKPSPAACAASARSASTSTSCTASTPGCPLSGLLSFWPKPGSRAWCGTWASRR